VSPLGPLVNTSLGWIHLPFLSRGALSATCAIPQTLKRSTHCLSVATVQGCEAHLMPYLTLPERHFVYKSIHFLKLQRAGGRGEGDVSLLAGILFINNASRLKDSLPASLCPRPIRGLVLRMSPWLPAGGRGRTAVESRTHSPLQESEGILC
jgi:hypothetical protein